MNTPLSQGIRGRVSRWTYLPRLLRLFWTADPLRTAVAVLAYAATGLLVTLEVRLIHQLIDVAQGVVQGSAAFSAGLTWAGAWVGLHVAWLGINAAERVNHERLQERVRGRIEEAVYRKTQALPLEVLDTPEHHDRLRRVRRGMDQRFFSTMSFIWGCVHNGVALVSLLAYLGAFHWLLPLILVAGTTPGVLLYERVNRERFIVQRQQTQDERRFTLLAALLTDRHAAAELRMFGSGRWFIENALELWQRLARERIRLAGRQARVAFLSDTLNAFVYIAGIAFSLAIVALKRGTIGAYAAFFYAVESFQRQYNYLVWSLSTIYDDLRYIKDYFDFTDLPSLDFRSGRRLAGPIRRGIVLENVSFVYPGSKRPALCKINLTIRPGERLALVGLNGAGKSTLVKLLMGLYEPTEGRILVDGVDLRTIARDDWYRRLGAVFQDFNRYETTAYENIAFGWAEQAHRADLVASAAARSGAAEVLTALPEGLQTHLGKAYRAGVDLSAGQWQRLAIARAYMRAAEILVLDEPAAALDAKAEADVYEHFARMAAGRTVILISHRLGSCRMADRIVVLQDGRVVEEGTHKDLMAQGGPYAAMYRSQAAWYR